MQTDRIMRQPSLLKEFARYCVLNVLGMIGLSCYILADTFFVAKGLGTNGLAALNLAIPVYSVIHGCGLMLGMGGATRYSIAKVRGEQKKGDAVFTHTLALAAFLAALYCVLGLFFSGQITKWLGADEAVFDMTKTYLTVILLFSPAFMANDVLLCFVRNDGEPQRAMLAMLCGSFSNIILDYIFIFPCGMGIFGAVLATGFAPLISMLVLLPFFLKKKNQFHIRRCRINGRTLGQLAASGVPSLVAELSSGIVIIVFNIIVLGLAGNVGVAAYGVIANLSLVVIAVYTGVAQGVQPLMSRYYGRGDTASLQKLLRYALISVLAVSAVIYAGMFLGADGITAVFNSERDMQLQEIAVRGLKIYFTGCFFAAVNIILAIYFTSGNRVRPAAILSVLRGIVLIIPAAFLLAGIWGMTGLWLAFPVTEFTAAVAGGCFLYKKNEDNIS